MSSFADSEPVFRSRASQAGLDDALVNAMCNQGVNTLTKFAFCSSFVPGSADETPFIRVLANLFGHDPTIPERASSRKLLHESYALVTTEMKQALERSEEVEGRRLTQPERSDRYKRQVAKLAGLNLKGPLEASDTLIDIFCSQYDQNRLKFVPWEKYTSKEAEVENTAKKEHLFSLETSGKLRIESKQPETVADTSSEILLQYALQRRGLGMDQANILEHTTHQKWVDRLIKYRMQVPPDGYARTTFKQLLEADKQLFIELSDRTRAGIQASGGTKPVEVAFETCMNLPEVMHHLQPLPQKLADTKWLSDSSGNPTYRPAPYQKGKGDKGKGKGKGPRMPTALVEMQCRSNTNAGEPICYGFNLKTCKEKVTKGRCPRGFHVCALPKCGKHHSALECPHRGGSGNN